jgi:hypothetical protein
MLIGPGGTCVFVAVGVGETDGVIVGVKVRVGVAVEVAVSVGVGVGVGVITGLEQSTVILFPGVTPYRMNSPLLNGFRTTRS